MTEIFGSKIEVRLKPQTRRDCKSCGADWKVRAACKDPPQCPERGSWDVVAWTDQDELPLDDAP
jgi:hypothetical protein